MKLSKKFFSAVFLCTASACMHNNGTQSQMKTENDSTVTPNLKCYADSNKIELYVKHNGDTKKYGVDLYTNDTNLSDAKYAYNTNNEHSEGRVLNLMTGKEKEVDPAFNGLEAEITNYEKIESGEANDPDNSGMYGDFVSRTAYNMTIEFAAPSGVEISSDNQSFGPNATFNSVTCH